ncbi:hypothetical protein DMA11_02980 [Marinilabiliaceae bacterium JC017]|nr:hypothetical protein DMA11_02980 [Marinilabiliaceae bacterium JC017]
MRPYIHNSRRFILFFSFANQFLDQPFLIKVHTVPEEELPLSFFHFPLTNTLFVVTICYFLLAEDHLPLANHLLPVTFLYLPLTNHLLPVTFLYLPLANHLLPVTFLYLPLANHLLPVTFHYLPLANHLLPVTTLYLPLTNHLLSVLFHSKTVSITILFI